MRIKINRALVSLAVSITLVGCGADEADGSLDTSTLAYEEVELCILRSPETRLAGAIVKLGGDRRSATVANSAHGKESSLKATLKSSDAETDIYHVEIKIPEQAPKVFDVSYIGKELIVHQDDELVMLIRPVEP